MTEWGVVGVVIALFGFAVSVVAPIIKLNTSITRLTVTLETVARELNDQKKSNHESHKRIWEKNEEQDGKLADHEGRITRLEDRR